MHIVSVCNLYCLLFWFGLFLIWVSFFFFFFSVCHNYSFDLDEELLWNSLLSVLVSVVTCLMLCVCICQLFKHRQGLRRVLLAALFPQGPQAPTGRTIEEGPVTTPEKPTPPPRPPRLVTTTRQYEEIPAIRITTALPMVSLSHRTDVVTATTTPLPTVIPISQYQTIPKITTTLPPTLPPPRLNIMTEAAMVHYTPPSTVPTVAPLPVSTLPSLPVSSPSTPSPSSSTIEVVDPAEQSTGPPTTTAPPPPTPDFPSSESSLASSDFSIIPLNDNYGDIDVKEEPDTDSLSTLQNRSFTPPPPLTLPLTSPIPLVSSRPLDMPTITGRIPLQPVPSMDETIADIGNVTPPLRASTPITTQEGPPAPSPLQVSEASSPTVTTPRPSPPSSPVAGPSGQGVQAAEGTPRPSPPASPVAGPSGQGSQGAEGGAPSSPLHSFTQMVTRKMSAARMKSPFKRTPLGRKAKEVTERLSQTAPASCEKKEKEKKKTPKPDPPPKPKKKPGRPKKKPTPEKEDEEK